VLAESVSDSEALLNVTWDFHLIEQSHCIVLTGNPTVPVRSNHNLILAQPKAAGSPPGYSQVSGTEVGPVPVRLAIDIQRIAMRLHDRLVTFLKVQKTQCVWPAIIMAVRK
jgi:hypothetical protein